MLYVYLTSDRPTLRLEPDPELDRWPVVELEDMDALDLAEMIVDLEGQKKD